MPEFLALAKEQCEVERTQWCHTSALMATVESVASGKNVALDKYVPNFSTEPQDVPRSGVAERLRATALATAAVGKTKVLRKT